MLLLRPSKEGMVEKNCSLRSPEWMEKPFAGPSPNWHKTSKDDPWRPLGKRVGDAPDWKKKEPYLQNALINFAQAETAGDPMGPTKWVRSSLRHVRNKLLGLGHRISPASIGRLLKAQKYSLKVNRKEKESRSQPPQRNEQFEYIHQQKQRCSQAQIPLISVDTKKKELIGNFKNAGASWCLQAPQVNVHDFRSEAKGIASPYGIYDLARNDGYVCVGQSADTAEFAVDAIVQWWQDQGQILYPHAQELVILADGGGSNSARSRLWKQQIQTCLAQAFGLAVSVHHYPTGCSKWNPVEHRVFSQISINWAGQPLESFDTMLRFLRGTQTSTGLCLKATLFDKVYQKGIKVSDAEMKALNIEFHSVCPQWNYTIRPRDSQE